MPLADRMRPKTLDEIAGQKHLLGKGAPFRRIAESGVLPSLVFYGPPGTGKTTTADIIARMCQKSLYRVNATVASGSEVKNILAGTDTLLNAGGIVLYIDEIQYFNKKQQQSLLEYVEDGRVTLICSTTENPYFVIYTALLSRATVFEFKSVPRDEIIPVLKRGLEVLNSEYRTAKRCGPETLEAIAGACGGDVRKALTALENTFLASDELLEAGTARSLTQRSGQRFDTDGDEHYDLLSAFQKSLRGSDENAALFYLARLLEGGDLLSPCRRLMVTACEDVGLAYPMASVIVKSCVDIALAVGLPEAYLPLAEAVILVATSPKSNSAMLAYTAAAKDVADGRGTDMPPYLRDAHFSAGTERGKPYKYPHSFPNAYVRQQYLPDDLKDRVYYRFGANRTEQAAAEYREKLLRNAEGGEKEPR